MAGNVFLREMLNLSSAEISINRFEPGFEMPFLHKHRENEEVYIVVSGKGQFQVDGDIFDVSEGSVVRVSKEGKRSWRASREEALEMICIRAKEMSCNTLETTDGCFVSRTVNW